MKRPKPRHKAALVSSIRETKADRFGDLITRSLPGADVLGNASLLFEHLPKNTRLPEISHGHTGEWILVLKGSMTAFLNGVPNKVRAGAIIAIPPGVRHRFVTSRVACEAISIFAPSLRIGPEADIVSRA